MKYGDYYTGHPPVGRPIWAVAYSTDERREDHHAGKLLFSKPVHGEIHRKSYKTIFVPYKKNSTTEFVESREVHAASRLYADTYEEAVDMLLERYDERIHKLYKMASDVAAERNKMETELRPMDTKTYDVSIAIDARIDVRVRDAQNVADAKAKAEQEFMTMPLVGLDIVGSHCVNATDYRGNLTDY